MAYRFQPPCKQKWKNTSENVEISLNKSEFLENESHYVDLLSDAKNGIFVMCLQFVLNPKISLWRARWGKKNVLKRVFVFVAKWEWGLVSSCE